MNLLELQASLAAKADEAFKRQRCDGSVFGGEVLCVSMPKCGSRRRHTALELSRWGFEQPRFIDAYGPEDEEVLRWFNSPCPGQSHTCFVERYMTHMAYFSYT